MQGAKKTKKFISFTLTNVSYLCYLSEIDNMAVFYPLKTKRLTKETADCTSVTFELPENLIEEFRFIQGQYLTLKAEIDGEEVRRSYSLCSSPIDGELKVAVKKIPDGTFSSYVNDELKEGDVLEVMTPMGEFYTELNPNNQKDYIAFAAGSGITPIMSIMKTVLEAEPNSTFTLFYVNKYASTVIFKEEIEGLKNRFLNRLRVFHFFTREISDIPLFSGRMTGEKTEQVLDKLIDLKKDHEFFLCGPQEMIFAVRDTLEQVGVNKKHIHFELFTPADGSEGKKRIQEKIGNKEKVCEVFIKDGGNSFGFNLPLGTDNILDAAVARGADLPYSCKGGVCSTCKAKLVEGEIEMAVNYALEPEEVEAGYILSCQAYPLSEKVVVDFDEAL